MVRGGVSFSQFVPFCSGLRACRRGRLTHPGLSHGKVAPQAGHANRSKSNSCSGEARWVKNGTPSTHPLHGDELRAQRRLQRESETSPFVFVSERGSPFTTAGFARMLERAAGAAGLELKAHPHMLRHACGYALANKGHDTRAIQGWLGHRSIASTAVYTALAPNRFKDFWRD
jgi:site-specific recombinase XerD